MPTPLAGRPATPMLPRPSGEPQNLGSTSAQPSTKLQRTRLHTLCGALHAFKAQQGLGPEFARVWLMRHFTVLSVLICSSQFILF